MSSCYCHFIRQSSTKRTSVSQTSWKRSADTADRKKRVACRSVISEKFNFSNKITTASIDLMNSPWLTDISKFPREERDGRTGGPLGSVRQFLNEKVAMHFNKIPLDSAAGCTRSSRSLTFQLSSIRPTIAINPSSRNCLVIPKCSSSVDVSRNEQREADRT